MLLSDFDFELDEALIALRPLKERSSSRLFVQNGSERQHLLVHDLPNLLNSGDLLVFNDTKVIPARLFGQRVRGDISAKVEITLIREEEGLWEVLAKPLRKLKEGDEITFGEGLWAKVAGKSETGAYLEFAQKGPAFWEALAGVGEMPLPPYIASKRAADAQDHENYQTVFAKHEGAIAAPTASLHFDEALLRALTARGVQSTFLTLHVGIGTFLPVKTDKIADHVMHSEWGEVSLEAALKIAEVKANGGRVIPVGTTALRLIETAAKSGEIKPFRGDTDIFITPGFQFNAANGLMTNFHLPKSTLMMLVSALMGVDMIRDIYKEAIRERYRFFSYGDASLLLPESETL